MTQENVLFPALTTQVTIGESLVIDALLDYEVKFSASVTENPVEDGFPVADHVKRDPLKLSMTAIFTPTPLGGDPDPNRLNAVLNAIQAIYKAGEPVTVTLRSGIYENMVLTSAPLPRNVQDGFVYRVSLEFTQVRRVGEKTEEVSEDNASDEASGSAGETEKDTGTASQTEIGTGVKTVDNTATVEVDTSVIDTSGVDYSAAGILESGKEITAENAVAAVKNAIGGRIFSAFV